MKKSAIMQMYFEHRGSVESIKPSKEYSAALTKIVVADEEMREELKEYPKLLKLYEKVIELQMEMEAESSDMHYYEGFSFGLAMGVEAGMR